MKIVCVFPTHKRKAITLETIKMLRKQTVIPHIILIGDSHIEAGIAKQAKVEYVQVANSPLSSKWQAGIWRAGDYNPDAILIIGSDTWLSPHWCEEYAKHLDAWAVVGSPSWYSMNLSKTKMEVVKRSYEGQRAEEPCGLGRLYANRAMRRMNWILYAERRNKHADSVALRQARLSGCKIGAIELDQIALEIKSSAWTMKHSWSDFISARGLIHYPNVTNPTEWLKKNMPDALPAIIRLRKGMK